MKISSRSTARLLVLSASLASSLQMDEDAMATKMYWTSERIASAIPKTTLRVDLEEGLTAVNGGRVRGRALQTVVENADWDAGGKVSQAVGRLFYTDSGYNYYCSGTAIKDWVPGRSLILTAAHCISNAVTGAFTSRYMFIPGQDDGGTDSSNGVCDDDPFGCWMPNLAYVEQRWVDYVWPANIPWDYGVLVVDDTGRHWPGYSNPDIEALDQAVEPMEVDLTNVMGLVPGDIYEFPSFQTATYAHYVGYPFIDDPDLRHCHAPVLPEYYSANGDGYSSFYAVNFGPGTFVESYVLFGCNLPGGASGGPGVTGGNSKIFSLESWGSEIASTGTPIVGGPHLYSNSFSCILEDARFEPLTTKYAGKVHVYDGTPCMLSASGYGDPHFETFSGELFDYHGACDLVLVETPTFDEDLGFAAHVRTKIKGDFSYIEAAAIQIGNDILEVGEYGFYIYNGVVEGDVGLMGGKYNITHTGDKKHARFDIDHNGQIMVTVKAHKDLVSVLFPGADKRHFKDVVGLAGDFKHGAHLSRSGEVMEDINLFGQEWQVRPGVDPELFASKGDVHSPQRCVLPSASLLESRRRRLSESTITMDEASQACAQFPSGAARDACIYDVILTNDLESATSGAF